MNACPDHATFPLFLDGELKESEARALRAHLDGCPRCQGELHAAQALLRRLAAKVPGAPSAQAHARLMAQVRGGAGARAAARARAPRLPARPWTFAGAGLALGAVAALALAVVAWRGADTPAAHLDGQGAFQARGAGPGERRLQARVGVGVVRVAPPPAPARLSTGDRVPEGAAFTLAYRNLERDAPVYLLAFGVDAAGEVHWLFPAHLTADANEPSVRLPPALSERALDESVALESPAKGRFRFVTVVTPSPLHVADVESLPGERRSLEALRRSWPEAVVEELEVLLE